MNSGHLSSGKGGIKYGAIAADSSMSSNKETNLGKVVEAILLRKDKEENHRRKGEIDI